jgi:pullulanase
MFIHLTRFLFVLTMTLPGFFAFGQFSSKEDYPVYNGSDLGLVYSPASSTFRIWSPIAEKVELIFYKNSFEKNKVASYEMERAASGTWIKTIPQNLKGVYYVFRIFSHRQWSDEVPDPYAKAVGTNGKRAVVIDLKDTNPKEWSKDISPIFSSRTGLENNIGGLPTDAIIYELHVRDASISLGSGIKNKGKFLGLAEENTKSKEGKSTGLDHLKELGVTHIHLLPSYDFYSVDESRPDSIQYNWGYDPLNYNVPEGSYSTNPENGITRIQEFKTMVAAIHKKGLRVVMDVVYNHTMLTEKSNFNQLVPGYFYRQNTQGAFSDASACGNETASERPMMRKFMIESLKYWVNEFHIDGFRFDLMGIHDIETMNIISKELHAIKPDIILYGEGWTAGSSPLPDSLRALKGNAYQLENIAVFSDDLRDGIKGSVFDQNDRGFASGKLHMEESIKFGIAAACLHPQVEYQKVNYSKAPYASSPSQVISYCECHDNNVLWDKLAISNKEDGLKLRKEMQKLSLSIVLTSQGISFLHAGSEFLRSKKGIENSFKSPDSINAIDWALKTKNEDVYSYVRGLIAMRKNHPAFRLTTQHEIASLINFGEEKVDGLVTFQIDGEKVGDSWKNILVAFNGSASPKEINLPIGSWSVFSMNNKLYPTNPPANSSLIIQPYSASILYKK